MAEEMAEPRAGLKVLSRTVSSIETEATLTPSDSGISALTPWRWPSIASSWRPVERRHTRIVPS